MGETQFCVLLDTPDTLKACCTFHMYIYVYMLHMVFVSEIYDVLFDAQFRKGNDISFARVLYSIIVKDIVR